MDYSSERLVYYDPKPGDVIKQPFIVRGRRFIYKPRKLIDELELFEAFRDLSETLDVWLAISMPVIRWRVAPTLDYHGDFEFDRTVAQIYARGWFDAEGPSIFMELP